MREFVVFRLNGNDIRCNFRPQKRRENTGYYKYVNKFRKTWKSLDFKTKITVCHEVYNIYRSKV